LNTTGRREAAFVFAGKENLMAAIEIVDFREVERGSLRGFAKVRVLNWKMTIDDIGIHESNNRRWAAMPARPVLDAERNTIRDEITGKPRYTKTLWFDSKEVSDRFSEAVLKALDQHLATKKPATNGDGLLDNFTL
jgi:hypothetical protein